MKHLRSILLSFAITSICTQLYITNNNLYGSSEALQALGNLVEIEEEFKNSLQLFNNKQYREALIGFQRVLTKKPDCAEAYFNIGLICLINNQHATAIATFEKAAELDQRNIQPHLFLASLWQKQGNFEKSIISLKRILELDPTHADSHVSLARLYAQTGQLAEAAQAYIRAINYQPSNSALIFEAGCLSARRGSLDEALTHFHNLLKIAPHHPEAHLSIAHIFTYLGRTKEAIPHLHATLEQWPEHNETHRTLGQAYLSLGEFDKGFTEYEWRLANNTEQRNISPHYLHTNDLAHKKILIRDSDNIADTIQFIRYAALLKKHNVASIILECRSELMPLLETNPDITELIATIQATQELPSADLQIPIASLPHVFKTTLDTVPATVPYLFIPPTLDHWWKSRLSSNKNLKIGIAWRDTKKTEQAFSENIIPLNLLLSCLPTEGVTVYLLQDPSTQENTQIRSSDVLLATINTLESMGINEDNLLELSGLINNLDLIISADNSIAHLAGALAKKTWVALPKNVQWRWMQNRTDSPWYPTMKLFRQYRIGSWQEVVKYMSDELHMLVPTNSNQPGLATAEVSIGELIDKMTILDIKLAKIKDEQKLKNLRTEREVLETTYRNAVTPSAHLNELIQELRTVNEKLWDIEDVLRYKEQIKCFDQDFVEVARSVYKINDRRFQIKREINELLGSRLREVKEHVHYA